MAEGRGRASREAIIFASACNRLEGGEGSVGSIKLAVGSGDKGGKIWERMNLSWGVRVGGKDG